MTLKYKCSKCGEIRGMALLRDKNICRNCANTEYAPLLNKCPVCNRSNVPSQFHHLAGKAFCKTLGIQICISCHAILTYQQQKWSNKSLAVNAVQGIYDLFILTLKSYQLQGHTPIECTNDAKFILALHGRLLIRAIPEILYSIGFRR